MALDHESRRIAVSNYFVQLTPFGLPGTKSAGDDRVCMAWLTPAGDLLRDDRFKDELTGQPCVAFDRPTSYPGRTAGRLGLRSRMRWHSSIFPRTRGGTRRATMLNKHATKIVDALLLLASAIGFLAIAWAESGPSAGRGFGPDFRLIGTDSRTYSRASFPSDTVLVVYFGFTTCWRACPTALNAIAQAVDDLGAAGKRVQPIFISLDPRREGPGTVDLYLKACGDRFVGLQGSEDQVRAAASEFGVSVHRIRYSADPTDYTMVHSSPVIVVVPHKPDPIVVRPDSSAEEIRAVLVSVLEPGVG